MSAYDAFLLVSFGGPEGPADVMPFLENVTRGRRIPRERLAEVEKDFAAAGLNLPVYWGNRNWHPMLSDTVAAMTAAGVRHALAFVTSAYGSYSSCRQYLDDIEQACTRAGAAAPRIDKIRHYFNHPGFVGPLADAARAAIERLPQPVRAGAHLVFTAHSIPEAMAAASGPPG